MYVCLHVCGHMYCGHMCMWRQRLMPGIFLTSSLNFMYWGKTSHWNPECVDLATLDSQLVLGILCFCFQSPGMTGRPWHSLNIYLVAGGSILFFTVECKTLFPESHTQHKSTVLIVLLSFLFLKSHLQSSLPLADLVRDLDDVAWWGWELTWVDVWLEQQHGFDERALSRCLKTKLNLF